MYLELPPGYSNASQPEACRLHKSLYSLKQASHQWYSKLSTFIIGLGFVQSKADYSLFTKSKGDSFTAILVYVDNVIVASNDVQCQFSKTAIELKVQN